MMSKVRKNKFWTINKKVKINRKNGMQRCKRSLKTSINLHAVLKYKRTVPSEFLIKILNRVKHNMIKHPLQKINKNYIEV